MLWRICGRERGEKTTPLPLSTALFYRLCAAVVLSPLGRAAPVTRFYSEVTFISSLWTCRVLRNFFSSRSVNTLQINSDLFCVLTLLVLLNNSDPALLLSPPLYQKKCEGENPHHLGSVSLITNQRMLDHSCPTVASYFSGAKSFPEKPNVAALFPLGVQHLSSPAV